MGTPVAQRVFPAQGGSAENSPGPRDFNPVQGGRAEHSPRDEGFPPARGRHAEYSPAPREDFQHRGRCPRAQHVLKVPSLKTWSVLFLKNQQERGGIAQVARSFG